MLELQAEMKAAGNPAPSGVEAPSAPEAPGGETAIARASLRAISGEKSE